jgi:UDP-N-acetylmuramoyl-L-alanyl-D-glutamate--2,6-diaminopimelate ligase
MTLERLAAALGDARIAGGAAREITAVVHDSRSVVPGALFVALRGAHHDGASFVGDAIARGAVAVVLDAAHAGRLLPLPPDVAALVVADEARALSRLADAFYGAPSRELRVIGVTGTNGKTTTVHLAAAALEAAGMPAGIVGTLGVRLRDEAWPLANTTPLADELQRTLAALRERGARAVAMEVSSHALALGRVADVRFAVAAFTNLTRDHLDFHGSFEAYAAAKRSLFEQAAHAVLNADDPYGARWATELRARDRDVVTYALDADADVRATALELHAEGSAFTVAGVRYTLQLPGRFNVQNALAALCIARALGVSDAATRDGLAAVERVPGRMERILGDGVAVYVDYAHTPDALERVLRAAREVTRGRVLAVFGCGGDRDGGKRPEMGSVASALADVAIVTSDNPRSEDPAAIIAAIVAGMDGSAEVTVEPERRAAIRRAVHAARPGDVVVVAGKGHEAYQIVGERTIPFDDAREVRAALAERGA